MPLHEYKTDSEIAVESLQHNASVHSLLATGIGSALLAQAPDWTKNTTGREARLRPGNDSPINNIQIYNPLNVSTIGIRDLNYTTKQEIDTLKVIAEAHKRESMLAENTGKYVDLINNSGFTFRSKDSDPADYLKARFAWMGLKTQQSFTSLVKALSEDIVSLGNAYLIKSRVNKALVIGGKEIKTAYYLHGDEAKGAIGAYFLADPRTIEPLLTNDTGKHVGWVQKATGRKDKAFDLEEVIHFGYRVPSSHLLGQSMYAPVIDDVRSLREIEEYSTKLLYKHLFPIIHHEVPPAGDEMYGLAEDVEQAAGMHSGMAPDGIVITPPGHKIQVIGVEGQAMDSSPYLKYMRERILMGSGSSPTIMGIEGSSAGTADVLTTQMHNRAKSIQQDIEEVINLRIIVELLLEGGFDPLGNDKHTIFLEFNEIEIESLIRGENHAISLFTNGVLTEDDVRGVIKRNPITGSERKKKYIYTDKIPVIEAQAGAEADSQKEVGTHQLFTGKALASHNHMLTMKQQAAAPPSVTQTTKTAAANGSSTTSTTKHVGNHLTSTSTGASRAVAAANNPSNQHGKRGAPRISSRSANKTTKAKSSGVPKSVKSKLS